VSARFFPRDEYFMRLALREAEQALEHDDVPVGAVVVREGEVIGTAHNEREIRSDPTAHAELLALREAAGRLEGWRILDSVLYVTLEPCAMCAGAIVPRACRAWCSGPSIRRLARRAACSTC
jgi:tRNA(adenine34) deaminase